MRRMRVTLFDESFSIFGELVKSESVSVEWWATILAHVIHSHYIFILQHHFVGRNHQRKNSREKNRILRNIRNLKILKIQLFQNCKSVKMKLNKNVTSSRRKQRSRHFNAPSHCRRKEKVRTSEQRTTWFGDPCISDSVFEVQKIPPSFYCGVVNGAVMRN